MAGTAVLAVYMLLTFASAQIDAADFASLAATYIGTSFALWGAVGTLWMMGKLYRERPRGGQAGASPLIVLANAASERWQQDRFISWLWPPVLFALLMATFNAFKQMVLPLAGYGFDPVAARLDRALFLGTDPWRITHAIFSSPGATLLLDHAYHGWFAPMSLGVMVCAWMPAATFRFRTQYLLSYMSVWIVLGSVLALLMPSAGPCFYTRLVGPAPGFDALMAGLAHDQLVNGGQFGSLAIQQMLFDDRALHHLVIGGGISAMPSVHNALAVLFALAAFRLNKWAGVLFGAYAFVIWIASIHLGWHYAVDGLVAAVLTFAIWVVCGRVARLIDRGVPIKEARPALA